MLILKCDDVHVTTMEFLERFVYSRLFIVNKALASGFLCCCGLLFEFHVSCLGEDLTQGLHRVCVADFANYKKLG